LAECCDVPALFDKDVRCGRTDRGCLVISSVAESLVRSVWDGEQVAALPAHSRSPPGLLAAHELDHPRRLDALRQQSPRFAPADAALLTGHDRHSLGFRSVCFSLCLPSSYVGWGGGKGRSVTVVTGSTSSKALRTCDRLDNSSSEATVIALSRGLRPELS